MVTQMNKQLDRRFSSHGFEAGDHCLNFVNVENKAATATVCLQGAHITDYTPAGQAPVLWMSPLSAFARGEAIRGGVPVLWPWFGPKHGQPPHGFVRTLDWQVIARDEIDNHTTVLVLGLSDTAETRAHWPFRFDLRLEISVGVQLGMTLSVCNTGKDVMVSGGGFHPYFNVADSSVIQVRGLAGCEYIDKTQNNQRKTLAADLQFDAEVNQVYVSTSAPVELVDPGFGRRIIIEKSGSATTVIWNPWQSAARAMPDFPDDGYQNMVCIEALNAMEDVIQLAPEQSHVLSQQISVQPP